MSGLTPAAQIAWQIAAAEAASAGHERLQMGHLVIGLLSLEKLGDRDGGFDANARASAAAEAHDVRAEVERRGLDVPALRRALRRHLGAVGPRHEGPVSRSDACREAFQRAVDRAAPADASCTQLLASVLEQPDATVAPLVAPGSRPEDAASPAGAGATPTLDRYGRDLTRLAAEGKLRPLVGRRTQLLQIVQTLAREGKSNPLLVGEAGVGKTALVEGVAQRAAAGKDGAVLGGRRIVELDLGALVGGTSHRGELEQRIARVIEEARAHPEVIVFIDEIHTLVGAGRAGRDGADAADQLKPALARGELRCIGATTPDEVRAIEQDPALERRFERIVVPEPDRDETLLILRGLRERWQQHHGVVIDDDALDAAVDLSIRYDADHRLPDKAIDLVDKASARTRVPVLSRRAGEDGGPSAAEPVGALTVAQVLAEKLGLPLELVAEGLTGVQRPRVLQLDAFLRERLVGQDEAIARVARRLQLAHSGLRERRGPLAVFLFLGPTGVGKTELARLTAELLFGADQALHRFDMSEYMEEHSVSRLVGSPPGYVGHDEEGQLTSRLRRRPYSVVLLDEVEKAHPRVLDLFLQLFDEGRLTDTHGRTADGRHSIVIMTSNLGGAPRDPMGYARGEVAPGGAALDEARRFFRPELLNRVDDVVVFRALDAGDAVRALGPLLAATAERLQREQGVTLRVDEAAEAFIAREGFSPLYGIRALRRAVEALVETPLAQLVLSGKIRSHRAWRVVYDEGGLYVLPDERA